MGSRGQGLGRADGGAVGSGRAVLIYDGACPVCTAAKAWIERRAVPGAFEFLTCQSPERSRRFPALSEAACLEAMQLVLPDGAILAGDRAIPQILVRLRGWRWLAAIFRVPGVTRLAPRAYTWIARHRYAISHPLRGRADRGPEARDPAEPSSTTSDRPS